MVSSAVYGPEGARAKQEDFYAVKNTVDRLTREISGLNAQIAAIARSYNVNGVWTSVAAYNDYLILTARKTEKEKERTTADFRLRFLQRQRGTSAVGQGVNARGGGEDARFNRLNPQTDASTQRSGAVTGELQYNIPAVREAYFLDRKVDNRDGEEKIVSMGFSEFERSNQPRKAVTDARDLWANGISSKGMFQTWTPPNGVYAGNNFIDGYDKNNVLGKATFQKYGFQFLYNPGTIAMTYSGNVDVDIALLLSGREKFNPVSTKATQSTISFEILLNRMLDMKYYDKTTGRLQPGQNASVIYGGRAPTAKDQADIVNKGTMYDVEFLLKTLFGFEVPSQLRNEKTADMGFVIPRPVELHLGNKLRYLVYVEGFALNHVIFDERMVPLFTTLSITANRVPDYGSEIATDGSR